GRPRALGPAAVGLSGKPCAVAVTTYWKALRDVVMPAIDAVSTLVTSDAAPDAIYLVGGSSRLPLVSTLLAARFPGVTLVMTDKPFTATAMGAAIQGADVFSMSD